MRNRILLSLTMAAAIGAATAAGAQNTVLEKNISTEAAIALASAALDACKTDGFNVAATVVDRSGVVKITLRSDQAGPHTIPVSQRKAYTAAATGRPTSALVGALDKFGANAAALREIDGFIILAGGQPLKDGDSVIGGIGVSGAPGEVCRITKQRHVDPRQVRAQDFMPRL